MSHDKIKAAARQRMAATAEPYAVARREVIRQRAIGSAEHAGMSSSAGIHSIVSPLVKRRRMRAVTAVAAAALLVAGAAALRANRGARDEPADPAARRQWHADHAARRIASR
jgi:hypothetical protein